MAHDGFKILDSDIHIIEPPDLWQRYIDPEYQDRAPRGLNEWVLDVRLVGPDGKSWGRTEASLHERHYGAGHDFDKNQERWGPYAKRGWTGEVQLEAMDDEGVDVAVCYPTIALFSLAVPGLDPGLAAAIARAYNDWIYDFCQADPNRLRGAGMISPFDIEDAVSEARRCVKELGFRSVFLRPNEVNSRNWHDPYYDPLWSTLEEIEVPVGFHEGGDCALPQVGSQFGENHMLVHAYCHPTEQMLAAGSFCCGGILERHPDLRVAFLEGNCSWLPFLMWRLDEHWERLGDVYAPELAMAPSEYFKRQCFASVECDEEPVKYVVDYMGSDRLIFSTDFPHSDAKFPTSVKRFLQLPLSDDDKRKILWDNCAQYYGIKD